MDETESDTDTIHSESESTIMSEFETPFFERISDDCMDEMEKQASEYIREYLNEHMVRFSNPAFFTTLVQDVSIALLEEWKTIDMNNYEMLCSDDDYDDIVDFIEYIQRELCRDIPLRQEPLSEISISIPEDTKIERIRSVNATQAKQRTPEWYEMRHGLLTASNLWKVFGTPSQYNSLIYEKCIPIETVRAEKKQMSMDSSNPMQMGVKYEPLSIMLYEKLFGTKITDVGCIPHAQYPYIGASPDGINMTPGYPRYGRMIEVKNIVNREITGIPLEQYWIQMQLQMEACDLETCDFIETRFKEIDDQDGCDVVKIEDNDNSVSSTPPQMGCILYFLPRICIGDVSENTASSEYVYMPLDISPYSFEAEEWINRERMTRPLHVLYKKTYWLLDQFSCVLVRRNREWFRAAQPKIAEAWDTIIKERDTGYEHRANKKKRLQTEVVCSENTTTHYIKNMPFSSNICLIKLD